MSQRSENAESPRIIAGPPQLPPLYVGQKIKSGPFTTTVTPDMVEERDRQNIQLFQAWMNEQRRRNMSGTGEDEFLDEFKEVEVRAAFVRKVFCILSLQLLFTATIVAVFMFIETLRNFMVIHWYLWIIALVCFIVAYCAISCSESARRTPPYNYLFLAVLTLGMSYLAAFASVFYSVEVVLITIGMTTVIVFLIGASATYCKFDLTMRTGMMMIIGWVAIISIIVMTVVLMFTTVKLLHMIISIVGTLLISMYLYFDVQVIMGGRRIELSPDEVVFATAQLYVDIVLLYQYILMFMGFLGDG